MYRKLQVECGNGINDSRSVVVAVSGGSDSVALLYWMIEQLPDSNLHVATVDHGLRSRSASEAQAVAELSDSLNIPHKTLVWNHDSSQTAGKSPAAAREARYRLLHEFAKSIGAQTIALGHTLDDQVETVFMRALRARPSSDTRGLSGMSEWSSLHGIRLWRPLLDKTRNELRKSLRERKTKWTDDPTNEDPNYERVRIRTALARNEGKLPSPNDIARLAKLSAKSKRWLNEHVARCLKSDVAHDFDGTLVFSPTDDCPYPVVLETLAFLILVAGGLAFRIPTSKITEFVNQARTNRRGTTTVGRCLIKSHQGQITVQRESRNLPDLPEFVDRAMIYDGRQLLQPSQTGKSPKTTPYIHALESFRPAIDDPVYAALMEVLNSPR